MRALIAIFIAFFIWKSPTGQSFTCDHTKTKRGHVIVCAPPLKHQRTT
jgi:hypothetical protein